MSEVFRLITAAHPYVHIVEALRRRIVKEVRVKRRQIEQSMARCALVSHLEVLLLPLMLSELLPVLLLR